MADALATSIIAKLTNWYAFNGDLTDSVGNDDLVNGLVGISYETGYGGAQRVAKAARAYATLASPLTYTTTSAVTVGGLFTYSTGAPNAPEFGYSYGGVSAGDEAFKIVVHPDGHFYVVIWENAGTVATVAADPLDGATNYPVTLRVTDTNGDTASSNQTIRIVSGGFLAPGTYFVVATKDASAVKLYVENIEVDSVAIPGAVKAASLPRVEIGRAYSPNVSLTAMQNCFTCSGAALTADEIDYIYNGGAYRDYATILAAS